MCHLEQTQAQPITYSSGPPPETLSAQQDNLCPLCNSFSDSPITYYYLQNLKSPFLSGKQNIICMSTLCPFSLLFYMTRVHMHKIEILSTVALFQRPKLSDVQRVGKLKSPPEHGRIPFLSMTVQYPVDTPRFYLAIHLLMDTDCIQVLSLMKSLAGSVSI